MSSTGTSKNAEPKIKVSRPYIRGYGVPKTNKGTLPWEHVNERMEKAMNYWIGTADAAGRPHAVPVWGLWVENALYFSGGADTRWCRNLSANPQVCIHLESGDDVIIIEGVAAFLTDPALPIIPKLDAASKQKYRQGSTGVPTWVLQPQVVYAWNQFPKNSTRWEFERER